MTRLVKASSVAALVLGVMVMCAIRTSGISRAATVNAPAQEDGFLNAAALSPGSVPGQMNLMEQSAVTPDQVANVAGPDVGSQLTASGLIEGYEQAFRAANPLSVLTGGPAGAGDAIWVFSSATGAQAWNQYESQNAAAIGAQTISDQDLNLNITSASPISLPVLGDATSGTELQGTATFAGQTVNVYIDAAFIQRGQVAYTALVVGLQSQQSNLVALAQTLDSRVAVAWPQLGS